LTEIEHAKEVEELKKIVDSAESIATLQLLTIILWLCFIGIFCLCIMLCQ